MRGLIKFLCWILIIGFVQQVTGGNSVSHTISIRVVHMNALTIEQDDHSESTTDPLNKANLKVNQGGSNRNLKWMTDQRDKKITVASRELSQKTRLQVEVVRCIGGEAIVENPVDDCDHDFVTSMSTPKGSCDFMYSVFNREGLEKIQGFHEVVYTITDVF